MLGERGLCLKICSRQTLSICIKIKEIAETLLDIPPQHHGKGLCLGCSYIVVACRIPNVLKLSVDLDLPDQQFTLHSLSGN